VLDAIELAVVVLSAISPDGGRRSDFVEVCGIDPNLINQGRGRRAARVLQGVVAVMRARAALPRRADPRGESEDKPHVESVHGVDDGQGEAEVQGVHHAV
jgi:hypothetical protein